MWTYGYRYSKCDSFNIINLVLVLSFLPAVLCDYGALRVQSPDNSYIEFCVGYNPNISSLPQVVSETTKNPLIILDTDGCSIIRYQQSQNYVVINCDGNCSMAERAVNVQQAGGSAVIVVGNLTCLGAIPVNNLTEFENINIPVAKLENKNLRKIQNLGVSVNATLYAPEVPSWDSNIFLLAFLAVGTVVLGGIVAVPPGNFRRRVEGCETDTNRPARAASNHNSSSLNMMNASMVAVLLVAIVGMLLLLYYFYDIFVYVIIAVFSLASVVAMFSLLRPLLVAVGCPGVRRLRSQRCKQSLSFSELILLAGCVGLTVVWVVIRNEDYAWSLQDILGVAFCVHMLNTIRLSSYKVCAILLCSLFVYDIFFVFITPLFTSKDVPSIMEQVATGYGSTSGESLPMLLKVPRFMYSPYHSCDTRYSMLGFGDIIVPGLLVVYSKAFDKSVGNSRPVYFLVCATAYALGLIVTFIALIFMARGQPALLYLVPACVGSVGVTAVLRGELQTFWSGKIKKELIESQPVDKSDDKEPLDRDICR